MEKRSRLGRGLSSLLSIDESDNTARPVSGSIESVPKPPAYQMFHVELSKVFRNEQQPRREFNEASLKTLAESIAVAGVIQPIIVHESSGRYEVIAGERRLRAAKLAGLETIPVIVRPIDPIQRSQFALIENIHREDLNPIDRAVAYRALLQQGGLTHQELATKLGEERSTIANHLRLLDLEETVRQLIISNQISLGHAKLLAGLDDPAEQARLAKLVAADGLSVRKLEDLLKEPASSDLKRPKLANAHIADLERQLSRDLQMRAEVRQAGKAGKGRLVIHYASLDQFDELLNRLGVKVED